MHLDELVSVLAVGSTLRPPERLRVFYGQSTALVRRLLALGTAKQLLDRVASVPVGSMTTTLEATYAVEFKMDIFRSLMSTSSHRLFFSNSDQSMDGSIEVAWIYYPFDRHGDFGNEQ